MACSTYVHKCHSKKLNPKLPQVFPVRFCVGNVLLPNCRLDKQGGADCSTSLLWYVEDQQVRPIYCRVGCFRFASVANCRQSIAHKSLGVPSQKPFPWNPKSRVGKERGGQHSWSESGSLEILGSWKSLCHNLASGFALGE